MSRVVGIIGVPTSAGAFALGQELAPQALRDAGLLARLGRGGAEVCDHGDRQVWRWRPDRATPRAQNLDTVVEIVQDTARRVRAATDAGEVTLVLGGDCTVGIGTVAGHASTGDRVGLIYFDTHADLNVPHSVRAGALDWMGMAHMLDEPGATEPLVRAGSRVPLLDRERVLLFAWGPEQATRSELGTLEQRPIATVTVEQVAADPRATATSALDFMDNRCERLLVHFDVDVIDFTDTPLSENTGRNEGLSYDHALEALRTLLSSHRLAGVTITELNPSHAEADPGSVPRFATDLAQGLAARFSAATDDSSRQGGHGTDRR